MALELGIDIIARFAKFQDALTKIEQQTKKSADGMQAAFKNVQKGLSIIGVAVGIREFVQQIDKAIDAMDELDKTAQRTGISVEKLSELRFAAQFEDIDFDALVSGIDKFNRALDETSGAFHRIGLDPKQFKGTDEALEAVAERFAQLEDGAGKTAIAMALFGRAGAQLIPLLNKGKAGLAELKEAADRLGVIVRPDQAKAAAELQHEMHLLGGAATGAGNAIANFLIPGLKNTIKAFNEGVAHGNVFLGTLHAIAVASKNIFFGADKSAIEQQRTDIENSKRQLEELLAMRARIVDVGKRNPALINPQAVQQLDNKIRETQVHITGLATALNNLMFPKKEPGGKVREPFVQSELSKVKLQNRLELLKQEQDQERQLEDIAFQHAEDSLTAHYAKLLEITKSGLQAELEAVNQAIATATRERADAETKEQRAAIDARIEAFQGRKQRLQGALEFAPQINTAQAKAALNTFRDSIEEIDIGLMKATGRAADAAEAENNLTRAFERRKAIQLQFGDDSRELRAFDRQRQLNLLGGQFTDLLKEQANTAAELAIREDELTTRFLEAGSSLEAELKLLQEVNAIKQEGIDLSLKQLEAEEELVLRTTEAGSLEREAGLLGVRSKRAALARMQAELSPAEQASRAFADVDRDTQLKLAAVQLREQSIQNRLLGGELTTQEALRETTRVRKAAIASLREQPEIEQELALKSGKFEDRVRAQQTTQAIQQLVETADLELLQMKGIFEDAFVDPFIDLVNNVKTADEALKAFFNNIAQSLLRIASQNIAEGIFGSLFGTRTGSQGGTDLLGSIFGLFGGGGTKTPVPEFSAMGNIMTARGPLQLARYASGGIARRPMLSLFGEGRMPEAYVPLPDGRSIPVNISMRNQVPGYRVQKGPSALVPQQQQRPQSVTLQIHPDAMQMTLRDWFEGEMARTMATR